MSMTRGPQRSSRTRPRSCSTDRQASSRPCGSRSVAIDTDLDPHGLLDACLAVEHDLGRVREERWGPRVIDIDVLAYEGAAVEDARLVLPHRYVRERAFVLVPLAEIAPDLVIGGERVI